MSIPLDQLYHYISTLSQSVFGNDVAVYRFYPHGSKNIQDLSLLAASKTNFYQWLNLSPEIFCNDQEPLNYKLYENINESEQKYTNSNWIDLLKKKNVAIPTYNLRGSIRNIWDKALLLHSEKRSTQIELYKNCQFIPVYYWSHAFIAGDWFRYAKHVKQNKSVSKKFLIYNRAWSGTREYRLKFLDLLVDYKLYDHCQTSISPLEPELSTHYLDHKFDNNCWQPNHSLENYFLTNTAHSHYSADFDLDDYESTDIEIVLETLFDDSRWHLTEKSLRPIALGQPFILTGTQGSLEYLRSYGFKTFDTVWDESYDTEKDSFKRLKNIIDLMKNISEWTPAVRTEKMLQAQIISDYNKKHFFSDQFFSQIHNELEHNLFESFSELEKTNTAAFWFQRRELNYRDPELLQFLQKNRNESEANYVLAQAKKYQLRTYNNQDQN
jgi:hypothetical protein